MKETRRPFEKKKQEKLEGILRDLLYEINTAKTLTDWSEACFRIAIADNRVITLDQKIVSKEGGDTIDIVILMVLGKLVEDFRLKELHLAEEDVKAICQASKYLRKGFFSHLFFGFSGFAEGEELIQRCKHLALSFLKHEKHLVDWGITYNDLFLLSNVNLVLKQDKFTEEFFESLEW